MLICQASALDMVLKSLFKRRMPIGKSSEIVADWLLRTLPVRASLISSLGPLSGSGSGSESSLSTRAFAVLLDSRPSETKAQ